MNAARRISLVFFKKKRWVLSYPQQVFGDGAYDWNHVFNLMKECDIDRVLKPELMQSEVLMDLHIKRNESVSETIWGLS